MKFKCAQIMCKFPDRYRDPRSSLCPKTSQFTLSNYFSLSMKQADKFSVGKFKYWWLLTFTFPKGIAFFKAMHCKLNHLQLSTIKAEIPTSEEKLIKCTIFNLLCASQSTEGLHMFSASSTSHRTAFEHFVKLSTVVKHMNLLFPRENPHTHFILALGTAICKLTCSHFITK